MGSKFYNTNKQIENSTVEISNLRTSKTERLYLRKENRCEEQRHLLEASLRARFPYSKMFIPYIKSLVHKQSGGNKRILMNHDNNETRIIFTCFI